MTKVEDLLRNHFSSKAKSLLATSQEVVTEHTGLRGSHREEVIRIYLSEILPRRFAIGKGMIYGMAHRSHETDIVIWDSGNYPSLQLLGHNMFFAESVKAVLEVKSRWSVEEFQDIKSKSKVINGIFRSYGENLSDELAGIRLELASLKFGLAHSGMLIKQEGIAKGGLIFRGGQSLWEKGFTDEDLGDADEAWPDLLLLLEAGLVIRKVYQGEPAGSPMGGYIEIIHAGDDALLVFTVYWIEMLSRRVTQVENAFYFGYYVDGLLENLLRETFIFPLNFTISLSGRHPIWSEQATEEIDDDERAYRRQLYYLKRRYGTENPPDIKDYWSGMPKRNDE